MGCSDNGNDQRTGSAFPGDIQANKWKSNILQTKAVRKMLNISAKSVQ